MSWILPPGVSTFASDIDFLYYLILVITGIAFVVVEVGLIVFMVKYRERPGRKAYYTHGSNKAEIIWTAVPAVTVVMNSSPGPPKTASSWGTRDQPIPSTEVHTAA